MKFPRSAHIFRGQLDATPFASVFFLVILFVLLGSLLYTPGVRLQLPQAANLPGTDQPTIAVAVDKSGRFYFENREVNREELEVKLRTEAAHAPVPLTLLVLGDKTVTEEKLMDLAMLASRSGIHDLLLAALPPVFTNAAAHHSPVAP